MKAISLVVFLLLFGQITPGQEKNSGVREVVISLSNDLSHSNANVRRKAAIDLGKIGVALQVSLGQLSHAVVNDRDPFVREEAALALRDIGPSAYVAVPSLIRALDDKNEQVRIASIGAIGATAPFSKKAIPKLMEFVKDKNPLIRKRAIGALSCFGPLAKEAVPVLIVALDDPETTVRGKESSVREYAILALREIGTDAELAASALMKLQAIGDVKLRGMALGTLAKIIPKDRRLIPLLIDVLKNKDSKELRFSAAYALGILGPDAKDAVPAMIQALAAKDIDDADLALRTRVGVVWALGEIGPAAKEALPHLEPLSSRGAELLRSEAMSAIKKIKGS